MSNFIKQLFCKHKMQTFHSNVYGDMINVCNCRSLWTCDNCGLLLGRDYLVENNNE